MFRTALKSLLANRLRFALTALSVVLGVAFVAGSFVFTDTINARFETLFGDVYAGVDATVRPVDAADGSLDASLLVDVGQVDGVQRAVGSVGGVAQMIDAAGEPIGGQGPPTIGSSWITEPALNILRIEDGNGRAPAGPGEVAIDVATADAQGLAIGDAVDIQTAGGTQTFTIVGLASFGTEDNLAGATIAAFETSEAQRLFGIEGRFSSIEVLAGSDVTSEQLIERLTAVAPADAEVVSGQQEMREQLDEVTAGLGFVGTALLAFAGIAVFVGAFVIQNTFRITVAQRVRELALLRAVGATGAQVTRMVLVEATVLAVAASAVGVGAGIGVAQLIKAGMEAVGLGMPDGPLTIAPRTIAVAMIVGVVVTVAAAVLPARRAAAVAPVAAMAEDTARPSRKSLRTRTQVGAALTTAGVTLMTVALVLENGASLALVGVGAALLFLGLSTLAPLIAVPVARVLSAPLRGITGTLARENTIRQPRRTASTASALMIGVALVVFASIFAASIRASTTDTLTRAFAADLTFSSTNPSADVSPIALDRLRDVDELAVVSPIRAGDVTVDGQERDVVGVEPETVTDVYDAGASIDLAELDDGLLVQVDVLDDHGWAVGDTIAVGYPRAGEVPTEIVGTFTDQTFANVLVSDATFTARIGDDLTTALATLADGVSLDDATAAARTALSEFPAIDVATKSDQIAAAEAEVDQLITLLSGLLGLALLIAVLGIANTLALSIVERTREIGLLRAVGMSRRQVRRTIRWEAVITALFGALLGLGIGTAVGFGIVTSLADNGLGTFELPAGQLAAWLAAAGIAGVLASVGPARRAARLDVLRAISYQ